MLLLKHSVVEQKCKSWYYSTVVYTKGEREWDRGSECEWRHNWVSLDAKSPARFDTPCLKSGVILSSLAYFSNCIVESLFSWFSPFRDSTLNSLCTVYFYKLTFVYSCFAHLNMFVLSIYDPNATHFHPILPSHREALVSPKCLKGISWGPNT